MIEVVKKWHYWAIGFIILNIFLSLRWLINDDIRFDVDISRDFLLIKEIITQKPNKRSFSWTVMVLPECTSFFYLFR